MATGWRDQYFRYKDFFLDVLALYKQRRDLKIFLELILSLSTVIIFVAFALKPTALTIISLYNQIQTKKETLSELNQKINDLQTANNVFNQNQNIIPDIDASVFGNPEPDTVSKQMLGFAAKDGVSLLGVSVGQLVLIGKSTLPKTSSDTKPLPENALSMQISVSVKGSYSSVSAFIRDLEQMRIPFKVDVLSVSTSQSEAGSAIVGTVTARVPYLGQQ